jgi:hypothetical protein
MIRHKSARNGPENDRLTPRQEAAAIALASGCTVPAAARESGAGERTIKTWLASLPAFRRRIDELRAEMTRRSLGRLIGSMTSAADTLAFLARKAKAETVRLGAARAVLELAVKLRESVELEARIAALEPNQPGSVRRSTA